MATASYRPHNYRHDVDTAALVRAYGAGDSCQTIAQSVGLTRKAVEKRLKKAGVTLRGHANCGARNGNWSGDNPTRNAGRLRAQRILSTAGPCARCNQQSKTMHRHHKDGNTSNNMPENLERLCPTCHIKGHRAEQKAARTGIFAALQEAPRWVEQYQDGATVTEIAAGTSYHINTVRRHLNDAGVLKPYSRGTSTRSTKRPRGASAEWPR